MVNSLIQCFVAAATDANLLAVCQDLSANSHRRVTLVAHDHDIRNIDGSFLLDDPTRLLRATRLGMPFDDIDSLDNNSVFIPQDPEHFADLAPFLAGDHHNTVVLANLHRQLLLHSYYNTSGATEIIFINFFVLISRVTVPNMRVPMGSF